MLYSVIFSRTFSYEELKNKYRIFFNTTSKKAIEYVDTLLKTVNKIVVKIEFIDIFDIVNLPQIKIKNEEDYDYIENFYNNNKEEILRLLDNLDIIMLYDFFLNNIQKALEHVKTHKDVDIMIDNHFLIYRASHSTPAQLLSRSKIRFSNRDYEEELKKLVEQLYVLLI